MCILCVIQKWSRRIATMFPWLVIPLIGLWALSMLLPPAFRFEITSPRLACVFVLLVTLFWYEILMPQLSVWQVRRNASLRERNRFEAIEMQKLRKIATRRCRNCLTPYRDQNPGGGKFMCSYCGHISKRPVLDLPVPPGMGNSGILKDLVGKGEKILNGKAWSDNGWICGQDWLENRNWGGGPFAGKSSYWNQNVGGIFGGEDHCLAEKSYSRVFMFTCKVFREIFLSVMWLWRKIFRVSSSRDDASTDAERRGMLDKLGENGGNGQESRGDKTRRKAEEKRQARLEKELLEEEERKQREEVARLVEERRRLRDEKMETEKERGKGSPRASQRDSKKEAERKRQERKKERDKGSSISNSDAEELEKKAGKENERNKNIESDRREQHRTAPESIRAHSIDVGHGFKGATAISHNRGNVGTRYLDRMRGTFLSSSRAFTGGGFFGKSNNSSTISREHKLYTSTDHAQTSTYRKEVVHPDWVSGRFLSGEDKSVSRPVLIEPQTNTAPRNSWQQLFTSSCAVSPPSNINVISRPCGKHQAEVHSPPFSSHPKSTQSFDNPINFGLPSPFTLQSFSFESTSSSAGFPLASEAMFPKIGDAPHLFLPEESEIFEDPCYVPDPVSLLGPVSESLDNFQLDLGFVTDTEIENPRAVKTIAPPSEVTKQSPIESPLSRSRVSEEKNASFLFPSAPKTQDNSNNLNEAGMWQMWTSSPLGHDGLGLVSGSASWLLPPEMNVPNKEDLIHPVPQKTMASLFKKDEQVISGTHSSPSVKFGNYQNGGTFNTSLPASVDGPWLRKTLFETTSSNDNQILLKPKEESSQDGLMYGNFSNSAANHQFEMSTANSWAKKYRTVQGSRDGIGNSPINNPHIGDLFSPPDVQSLWSYD